MTLLPILDTIPPVPPAAPCRLGCTACCHGPFDISPAEAMQVYAAVQWLPEPQRSEVRRRAWAQIDDIVDLVTSWRPPWDVLALDPDLFDALPEALAGEPCPALDPGSGACLIRDMRPSTCRLMGMSVVTSEGDLLENACPIQDEFPGYAELPPVPFDLETMEQGLDERDRTASGLGWVTTTIAGAIAAEADHPAKRREGPR